MPIAAIDLCVVRTLTFECLFAVLVIGHGRRQLLWFAVTRHPTAEWLAQQMVKAFPWDTAPSYLVRDNDGAYGQTFKDRVRAMGIRDRPILPRSPWQNPYVERLIGALRRDCLDHVLIFGERHLRRVLTSYSVYYNETRTHLGLGKDAPLGRAVERSGPSSPYRFCAVIVTRGYNIREGQVTFHLEEATIDDLHRAIRGGKDKLRRSGQGDMVHDDFGPVGEFGGRVHDLRSEASEPVGLRRRTVPNDKLVTELPGLGLREGVAEDLPFLKHIIRFGGKWFWHW